MLKRNSDPACGKRRKELSTGDGSVFMENNKWIRCPICGNKTHDRIREDTVLKNYPLYFPKCKQESLIDAKNLQITVIKGLEMKMQS